MKKYVYFFTRQDISGEQQLVQTSHVAFKLGVELEATEVNADETYFIVIGVRNLEALWSIEYLLDKLDIEYEAFEEPDIGDEMTSIATYPLSDWERKALQGFNLLRMGS